MVIKRFEEMKMWQDARVLTKRIYDATAVGKFSKDFGLRDQIQRASVSAMSNIVEGYECDNNKEFIKFLGYSKGSTGEVRSLLYVALDNLYINETNFNELKEQCILILQQISNFEKYLRKSIVK